MRGAAERAGAKAHSVYVERPDKGGNEETWAGAAPRAA
jgi:hypothetical protein